MWFIQFPLLFDKWLWHTIYLGQQHWGALYSFAPHLCHPLDISQINHTPRSRPYSLILKREKGDRMRCTGGSFGFISLFRFWAILRWFSARNSGSASVNSFFLSGAGRCSMFTVLTLCLWGFQRNIWSSVFNMGRNKSKAVCQSARIGICTGIGIMFSKGTKYARMYFMKVHPAGNKINTLKMD